MEDTQSTKLEINLNDTEELNGIIKSILKNLKDTCSDSFNFLEDGIEDSLASRIRKIVEDPFQSSMDTFRNAEVTASHYIQKFFEFTFSEIYGDLIEKVYEDIHQRDYHQYFIILKKDEVQHRGSINYFIFQYNRSNFRKRFPLIIHYIPKEFESKLKNVVEVNLDHAKSSRTGLPQ